MRDYQSIAFLLALAATSVSAGHSCLSAVSWGDPRVDLFGVAPDKSIWHKFYTGYDWQPELFERIPSAATSCPAVSSWGNGRLDLVWVDHPEGNVLHKYFAGGEWGPSWEEAVDLGGHLNSVQSFSWGVDRLSMVGNDNDGSYQHKAWTGTDYFPAGQDWESLGGNFSSQPGLGSWGQDRLNIAGISAESGSLLHMYWAGNKWSDWEDLEGGPFIGDPIISSWGPERLDIWTVDSQGELNHKFWDGFHWVGWEQLGGNFSQVPQVVHWSEGHIDIVGKNADDNKYYLKSFDGQRWNPSIAEWYILSGPYSSEPRLLTKANGQNFFYVFGIDVESSARMQLWSGYEWQPSAQETWPLGNVSKPYPDGKSSDFVSETHPALVGGEL